MSRHSSLINFLVVPLRCHTGFKNPQEHHSKQLQTHRPRPCNVRWAAATGPLRYSQFFNHCSNPSMYFVSIAHHAGRLPIAGFSHGINCSHSITCVGLHQQRHGDEDQAYMIYEGLRHRIGLTLKTWHCLERRAFHSAPAERLIAQALAGAGFCRSALHLGPKLVRPDCRNLHSRPARAHKFEHTFDVGPSNPHCLVSRNKNQVLYGQLPEIFKIL